MRRIYIGLALAVCAVLCIGAAYPSTYPPLPVFLMDNVDSAVGKILGTSSNPMVVSGGSPVEVVLSTTGATPGLGLALSTSCHVTSVKVGNPTASSAYFFLSNGALVPDAGFTAMVDTPTLVPPNATVVLGNDHFGVSGLFLDAGCSLGMSSTGTSDGGHGAGTFTAVTKDFDISVYGYTP